MEQKIRKQLAKPFIFLIISLGILVCLQTSYRLTFQDFDFRFLLFVFVTVVFGSRIVVQIPGVKGQVSISDTFLMLSILIFGGEWSVILAGIDALFSSIRITKSPLLIAFNSSVFVISTYLTVWTLKLLFGSLTDLAHHGFTSEFVIALCLMGLVQYLTNSGLIATGVALRSNKPVWKMWRENFLWTSITYFAGASAAGFITQLIDKFGIFAFLATVPIIAVVYFTYTTYLKNVEAASAQAEIAEKHIVELSHHIAEQDRISRALKESEEYFRNAFDNAAGMALVSPGGQWLEVNESLCKMLGYEKQELTKKHFQSITHPNDLGTDLANIYKLSEDIIPSYQLEKRYLHKKGHVVWVLQNVSLIRDEKAKLKQYVFQIQDITDRKRAEDQIHYAAFHDALTGLPNRTLLSDRLSMSVERSKRNINYQFAVLFIDLDRFKVVNDSLGHNMGDKLLVELSRRLQDCVRKVDTVARLGGDEFAILLDDITDAKAASETAERLQEKLREPFTLDGHKFHTTASIGIAYSRTGYEKPEDILRDADTAMYKAKANGKARHELFNISMHTHAIEALELENELRVAVERGEIFPCFQPIVLLKTGEITGFEALARWNNPRRGIISPADFIPLAEETGLIIPLGLSMLRQSCQQVYKWQQKFIKEQPLTVSVNLSGKQFRQADLVEQIEIILHETNFNPNNLRLEITESVVMENAASTSDMLKQLKSIGVQLSIDDFGTGYSSLSYLHSFPFDILKVDRSFVTHMAIDKESRSIVKTIVTLAAELDKVVVAEGVEFEEHRTLLTDLSCEYGQGFLFSKPLDAVNAERLLVSELDFLGGKGNRVPTTSVDFEQVGSFYTM
ncbi:MAG: EAL domain-containing protein [Pyrinomonadaceae bacterium]